MALVGAPGWLQTATRAPACANQASPEPARMSRDVAAVQEPFDPARRLPLLQPPTSLLACPRGGGGERLAGALDQRSQVGELLGGWLRGVPRVVGIERDPATAR